MELILNMVNAWKSLNIFAKSPTLDIWQASEDVFDKNINILSFLHNSPKLLVSDANIYVFLIVHIAASVGVGLILGLFTAGLYRFGVFLIGKCLGIVSIPQKQPLECSLQKGILKNFAKFTRKHICWCLFLIKLQA